MTSPSSERIVTSPGDVTIRSTGRAASQPKVVLIGGAPGAGKTTLAKALAADLAWPWLSGDDLALAARAMTTATERPELHPMAATGHTVYFTETAGEQQVADAIAFGEGIWPAMLRVIQMHAVTDEPVVIDWWLFSPAVVAGLALDGVASLWLHIDSEELWRRERANDFYAASSDPERMLANFMQRSTWRNDLIRTEATAAGLPLLHQPGDRPVTNLVTEALGLLASPGDATDAGTCGANR